MINKRLLTLILAFLLVLSQFTGIVSADEEIGDNETAGFEEIIENAEEIEISNEENNINNTEPEQLVELELPNTEDILNEIGNNEEYEDSVENAVIDEVAADISNGDIKVAQAPDDNWYATGVETRDVEVYVTDGYSPLANTKVELNGQVILSDSDGMAFFARVPTSDEEYTVITRSEKHGQREAQILLINTVKLDDENAVIPICEFTVSYWSQYMPDQGPSISTFGSQFTAAGTWDFHKLGALEEDTGLYDYEVQEYNGLIYILGNTIRAYNPSTGKVATLGSPSIYYTPSRTFCNGKLYYIGAYWSGSGDGWIMHEYARTYDIASNTWQEGSYGYGARFDHGAIEHDGKIYISGGWYHAHDYDWRETIDSVMELDTSTGKWTEIGWSSATTLAVVERYSPQIMFLDKQMGLEIYNVKSGYWFEAGGSQYIFDGQTATDYNGKLYLIGGELDEKDDDGDPIYKNTVSIYDGSIDMWSTGESMYYNRGYHTASEKDGLIYVAGGYGGRETFEIYDIANNTWQNGPDLYSDIANGYRCVYNTNSIIYEDKLYLISDHGYHDYDFYLCTYNFPRQETDFKVRVTDKTSGAPISKAEVLLEVNEPKLTDSNGYVYYEDIEHSNYTISIYKDGGYYYHSGAIDVEGMSSEFVIPLYRKAAAITGNVKDNNGNNLADVKIAWTTDSGGSGNTTTNTSGNYTISCGTNWGTYTITASKTGFITQTKVVTVGDGNLSPTIPFTLSELKYSFTSNVKDATSKANLSGANVKITGTSIAGTKVDVTRTPTNTSGNVTFSNIPYGTNYTFTISKPSGYYDTVLTNQPVTYIATKYFTLARKSATITGAVYDRDNIIVGNVRVSWIGPGEVKDSYFTDNYGDYIIDCGTNWGEYTITTSKEGYLPDTITEYVGDGALSIGADYLNMTLIRGNVNITVKDGSRNNALVTGAKVDLMQSNQVAYTMNTTSGVASFTGVRYGTYTIRVSKTGYVTHTDPTQLSVTTLGETYERTVPITAVTGYIMIEVKDIARSVRIGGAQVKLIREDGEIIDTIYMDDSGIGTFFNVPYGKYTVEGSKDRYGTRSEPIEVIDPRSNYVLIYLLPTTGNIMFYVSDGKDSSPLADAELSWTSEKNSGSTKIISGNYCIENVPFDTYTVTIRKDGYYTLEKEIKIIDVEPDETVKLTLVPITSGNITVCVQDNENVTELDGADVKLQEDETLVPEPLGNGEYIFRDIPLGTYTAEASKDGYTTELAAEPITINATAPDTATNITLNVIRAAIAVNVIDSSRGNDPVSGAVVKLLENGVDTGISVTFVDGKYIFNNVPYGTYTAQATKENYEVATSENILVAENAATYPVPLPLTASNGNIDVEVKDSEDADTYITNTTLSIVGTEYSDTVQVENGVYSLANVPFGTYVLTVTKDGHTTAIKEVNISAESPDTIEPLSITLIKATIIAEVKDAITGSPINGAVVKLLENGIDTEIAVSFENGKYIFNNVPYGTYTAKVTAYGYDDGESQPINVTQHGETYPVSLPLTPSVGSITVEVKDKEAQTIIEDVAVRLDGNELIIPESIGDGKYTFKNLAFDTYKLMLTKDGYYNGESENITIEPSNRDAIVPVSMTYITSGSIEVTVIDANSTPIEGAKVWLGDNEEDSRTTGSEGRALFLDLEFGSLDSIEYKVNVTKYGFMDSESTVVIERLDGKMDIEPTISLIAQLTITDIISTPLTSYQNMPLGPTERTHTLGGLPNVTDAPSHVIVVLDEGSTIELPVIWELEKFDPYTVGVQKIEGEVVLVDGIINPDEVKASLVVTVEPVEYLLMNIDLSKKVRLEVERGTTIQQINEMLKGNEVDIEVMDITDGEMLFVYSTYTVQESSDYTQVPGEYILTGLLTPNIEVFDPEQQLYIYVTVLGPLEIDKVNTSKIESYQNMPLAPTDRTHTLGTVPNTIDTPSTVTAVLENGAEAQLEVIWDLEKFDPYTIGEQEIKGEIVLEDGIINPGEEKASLIVTVKPAEYLLANIDLSKEVRLEVESGTTIGQINEMLKGNEVDIEVIDMTEGEMLFVYSTYTVGDSSEYMPDIPGEYILTAFLTPNIEAFDVIPELPVYVTVLKPREIVEVEVSNIEAYQCVEYDAIDNIPEQVTVMFDNGVSEIVDVVWDAENYAPCNSGVQLVHGTLINLPGYVIPPSVAPEVLLMIDVQPVNYKITDVLNETPTFTFDAGETLEELMFRIEEPVFEVRIESITPGIDISVNHQIRYTLDQEKNPHYHSQVNDEYSLIPTLLLDSNIFNENDLSFEVKMHTKAVDIDHMWVPHMVFNEGTEFEDVRNDPNIPIDVLVFLTNGRFVSINVYWGEGKGHAGSPDYEPYPEGITEDNPVRFCIEGEYINVPQYINVADTVPTMNITMLYYRLYYIQNILPERIPETGTTEVKLGSTLDEVYNQLETKAVDLELLDNQGNPTQLTGITFTLRAEDNEHYDSMTVGTYDLKAHLLLPDSVENPDELELIVTVETKVYTISSSTGVIIRKVTGTSFDELGLPDKVNATYTSGDGKEAITADWEGVRGAYNPSKIGGQILRGTFDPLPAHILNPNNRQPTAAVTLTNPTVTVLSAKVVDSESKISTFGAFNVQEVEEEIPGFIEYKFEVELLHDDGTITTEIISIFEEVTE